MREHWVAFTARLYSRQHIFGTEVVWWWEGVNGLVCESMPCVTAWLHVGKVADLVEKAICAVSPDLHGAVTATAPRITLVVRLPVKYTKGLSQCFNVDYFISIFTQFWKWEKTVTTQNQSKTLYVWVWGGWGIKKQNKNPALCLHAVASPRSDGDLVIYSFLHWSQRFAKTASTIQGDINNQGQSRGLAGQLEQNPNK